MFVSLVQGDLSFNDPSFHLRELTLFATRNAVAADFTRIIAHIEAGEIDTTPLDHAPRRRRLVHRCVPDWPRAAPVWSKASSRLLNKR